MQIQEIDRHKWIESQKAGRDLGEEAVFDWVLNYAEDFRRYVAEGLGENVVYPNGVAAPAMDIRGRYCFERTTDARRQGA
ncbi:MAG: hypothetical protein ACNA71_00945 [Kiritimatiellia bacterium]